MAKLEEILSFAEAWHKLGKSHLEVCDGIEATFGPAGRDKYASLVAYTDPRPARRHVYRLCGESWLGKPTIVILDGTKGHIEADLPEIKAAVVRIHGSDSGITQFRSIEYLGYEGG